LNYLLNSHHGLCGCASPPRSPVLKETGLGNGKWQFSTPPQNTPPLTDKQKFVTNDCVGGPTPVPNFVHIRPEKTGEIITNFKIYLHFFSRTHLQVRPVDVFLRVMAQTTRTCARVCFIWSFVDIAFNIGSEMTNKANFGA